MEELCVSLAHWDAESVPNDATSATANAGLVLDNALEALTAGKCIPAVR
jgi:hypothetical protein